MNNCFQLHLNDGTVSTVITVHPDYNTGEGFIVRKDNDTPKNVNTPLADIRSAVLKENNHLRVVISQEWFDEGYDHGEQQHRYAMDRDWVGGESPLLL